MATLESHHASSVVKLLLLGNSKAGKTGLLATLLPRYRLFLCDFDNGLDILLDPKVLDPKHRSLVHYESFYDKSAILAGKMVPQVGGFPRFLAALNDWKEDGKSLGGVNTWGPNDIVVIDSLTFLGELCMNYALHTANKLLKGERPSQPDWGNAIDYQQSVIEMLYNPAVNCNVIVTAHLTPITDEGTGAMKLFPSALGRKFPTKIGRFFNSVVLVEKVGSGATTSRRLQTQSTFNVDLGVAKPSAVPSILDPDLGKLFALLKGEAAPAQAAKPTSAAPSTLANLKAN